ncbi:MAG: hypothetical protein L0220_32330, partial [Acidobacteria bacterium]|nr:hypothetical protein [Acidobacteriota bacterium]
NRRDDYSRRRNLESVSWRGRVDGESVIKFRGDQSFDERLSGRGVSGAGFQFSSPLPSQPVNVSLVNTEGRGEILLIDQPNRDNDYTASVRIRDNRGGSGNYAFTLTWDRSRSRDYDSSPGGRGPRDYDNSSGGRGRGFRWEGRVDGRDLLFIRGDRLTTEHQSGQPITDENYRFFQSLPFERRSVTVRKLNGRGTVRVIQQPSRENGFSAAILIEDPAGGADRYEIEVEWQ